MARLVWVALILLTALAGSALAAEGDLRDLRARVIRQESETAAALRERDALKAELRELERRLQERIEDQEKSLKDAAERQEKRIGDQSLAVERLGVHLTATGASLDGTSIWLNGLGLLLTFGGVYTFFFSNRKAEHEVQKWVRDEGRKFLKQAVKETVEAVKADLAKSAEATKEQIASYVQTELAPLREQAAKMVDETAESAELVRGHVTKAQAILSELPEFEGQTRTESKLTNEQSASLSDAAIAAAAKPESERTVADWLVLGSKALDDKDYKAAVGYLGRADAHSEATVLERADALNRQGVAYYLDGQWRLALLSYEASFQAASSIESVPARVQASKSLFNKGIAVKSAYGPDAAIAVYDEVVRRYGDHLDPALRELVVHALINKGLDVFKVKGLKAAVAIFDELVRRYVGDPALAMREQVAGALVIKGLTVLQEKENDVAVSVFDEVVRRYGDDPAPALREPVAKALLNKGNAIRIKEEPDAAIDVYDEIVRRYGDYRALGLRIQVAKALFNKGFAMDRAQRPDAAIAVYDDVVRRYGDDSDLALQEQVANARAAIERLRKHR
jgi:tetratricopeptide (TPR) repeat protein